MRVYGPNREPMQLDRPRLVCVKTSRPRLGYDRHRQRRKVCELHLAREILAGPAQNASPTEAHHHDVRPMRRKV